MPADRKLTANLGIFTLFIILSCSFIGFRVFKGDGGESGEEGKKIFEKYGCFVCHGNEGSGSIRNKNSFTGGFVPSLTYVSRAYKDQALKDRIIQGPKSVRRADPRGVMPSLSMPYWRGVIPDSELTSLVFYLRGLAPEEDEEPKPVAKERPPVPEFMLSTDNCRICHSMVTQSFETNIHYGVFTRKLRDTVSIVCVDCHGSGREHAKKYGEPTELTLFIKESATPPLRKNEACLQCHENGNITYWTGSVHEARGLVCMDCHRFMEPASPRKLLLKSTELETCLPCHQQRKAQLMRSSHMPVREGKVTCSDCHNSHGTSNEKLLTETTINENCYKCHAEMRGPFLWEHQPVTENCLNCHDPHGSNHDKLLVMERPRLCQRCHIESAHMTLPQLSSAIYFFNRSCQNCHSQIHGSNSPSGAQFHR